LFDFIFWILFLNRRYAIISILAIYYFISFINSIYSSQRKKRENVINTSWGRRSKRSQKRKSTRGRRRVLARSFFILFKTRKYIHHHFIQMGNIYHSVSFSIYLSFILDHLRRRSILWCNKNSRLWRWGQKSILRLLCLIRNSQCRCYRRCLLKRSWDCPGCFLRRIRHSNSSSYNFPHDRVAQTNGLSNVSFGECQPRAIVLRPFNQHSLWFYRHARGHCSEVRGGWQGLRHGGSSAGER